MIAINQFPIDRYPFVVASKSVLDSSRQGLTPHRKTAQVQLKSSVQTTPSKATFSVGFQGLTKDSTTLDYLFTVEYQNQLRAWLEDTLIQAKVFMSSPHLGHLKARGEQLFKMLTELREIVMMLSHCQNTVSIDTSYVLSIWFNYMHCFSCHMYVCNRVIKNWP